MAYIQDTEQELIDGQQGQPGQGSQPMTGGESTLVSGGQGVSNAGVGAGGTGGWTNIQAYLGANKGDTGSAQALNKTVNDQFGQERSSMETGANEAKAQGQKSVDDNKVTNEQADQSIKSASDNYSWDGNQKSDYTSGVQKMQGALNNQYAGPTSYNHAFGTQTQNYGSQLKDDTGFGALMKNVYSSAAGKPLSSGQYALQEQLDVNNQGLVDARKNLGSAYDQLGTDRDKTVTDTTAALGANEQAYRENQNALRDYLGQQANSYDTKGTQAEIDARGAYATDREGKSGLKTGPYDIINSQNLSNARNMMAGADAWGDNLNYRQLQNEQDFWSDPNKYKNPVWMQTVNANNDALQGWYGQEDAKYANTADPEKRSYNAIQDFLNSESERKKQGFQVRK